MMKVLGGVLLAMNLVTGYVNFALGNYGRSLISSFICGVIITLLIEEFLNKKI